MTVGQLRAAIAELRADAEVKVMQVSAPGWWEVLNLALSPDGKTLLLRYETVADVMRDAGIKP